MTNFSRCNMRHGKAYAFFMASVALIAIAPASYAETAAPAVDTAGNGNLDVVVVGSGETRSVSTLVPSNLDALPPGTSIQKALNMLPGVSAQSIDALGVNEQSLSLQVRGFSTTHLGYTLDGMPLGDGAYNNCNGLKINQTIGSEKTARTFIRFDTGEYQGLSAYVSDPCKRQIWGDATIRVQKACRYRPMDIDCSSSCKAPLSKTA